MFYFAQEWKQRRVAGGLRSEQYSVVYNETDFNAVDPENTEYLMGELLILHFNLYLFIYLFIYLFLFFGGTSFNLEDSKRPWLIRMIRSLVITG